MRICFLAPIPLVDCIEIENGERNEKKKGLYWLTRLVLTFINKGHSVSVCTFNTNRDYVYQSDSFSVFAVKLIKHGRLRAFFNFNVEINKMLRKIETQSYDIYNAHWCYEYASIALKIDVDHTVVTMHDIPEVIEKYMNNYYWRKKLSLGKRNVARILHFTGVSPYTVDMIESNGDRVMIPNYVVNETYFNKIKQINVNNPTFISVTDGTDTLKNTSMVIKTFALTKREIPEARLKMVGWGLEPNSNAYKLAKELGIADSVQFMGPMNNEDVLDEFYKSDVLLHLSREENCSLAILEAMSCGCLIVGGERTGGVPWELDYGNAGVLVDVEDVNSVSEKIIKILNTPNSLHSKIKNATKLLKGRYNLDIISEQYLDVYDSIISRK